MRQPQRIGNSRKVDELTPEERHFCALRVRGYSQTQAWRDAFAKPRVKGNIASSRASEVARRPRVAAHLKMLFREAKKSDILSHSEYLDSVKRDWQRALDEGNMTAAASFARLAGQAIGSLSETLRVDERMSDEQLLDRLAGDDPTLAAMLRRKLDAKKSFDA